MLFMIAGHSGWGGYYCASEYPLGPGLGHGRAPAAAQSSTKNQYSKMALNPLKRHMVA